MRLIRLPSLLLFALLIGGCARYEYDLVEPSNLAQHIGEKNAAAFRIDPVEYHAKSDSGRLVLRLHNSSSDPLKLRGDDSFAVDPNGESHPLPTRTIAPNSSTTLTFPPVRPTFRQSGPSFGVGVGVGVSDASPYGYGRRGLSRGAYYYDDSPRYYRLEDDGTMYWDWKGDGTEITVRIAYERRSESFHHDFTFRRVKR